MLFYVGFSFSCFNVCIAINLQLIYCFPVITNCLLRFLIIFLFLMVCIINSIVYICFVQLCGIGLTCGFHGVIPGPNNRPFCPGCSPAEETEEAQVRQR